MKTKRITYWGKAYMVLEGTMPENCYRKLSDKETREFRDVGLMPDYKPEAHHHPECQDAWLRNEERRAKEALTRHDEEMISEITGRRFRF